MYNFRPVTERSRKMIVVRLGVAFFMMTASCHLASANPFCTDVGLPKIASVLATVETSPLYKFLSRKLGSPVKCIAARDQGSQMVELIFAHGGILKLSVNETLESSAEDALLPASPMFVSRAEAIRVLQAEERSSAAPNGCGIDWANLRHATGSPGEDMVATGDSCNCRAYTRLNRNAVTAMGFSLAC